MMRFQTPGRFSVCMLLGLTACVTVLPKSKPATLYRFGVIASTSAASVVREPQVLVGQGPTTFPMAAAGDRILTSQGLQTHYIAGARWLSPASVLFDQAEFQAFDRAGVVGLIGPGQSAAPKIGLQVDVQTFEARFEADTAAPPTVWVVARGRLTKLTDNQTEVSQLFRTHKPAAENRVGAIVDAFDTASTDILRQIAEWTTGQVAAVNTGRSP